VTVLDVASGGARIVQPAPSRAWSPAFTKPARSRGWWTTFAVIGVTLSLIAAWTAGHIASLGAVAVLQREAASSAALHAAVLRSELEKHRSLPFVLAEDPDVRTLLEAGTPGRAAQLNGKLEGLSARTRAAVIYVMDRRGLTIAASNFRLPATFVGSNYSFRPYFTNALRDGSAEYFALGTVSRRPGLFLARRVEGAQGPLGVVAVKVELDSLEAEWRLSGSPTLVSDRNGVVLITSNPEWRFRTVRPLSPQVRARLKAGQQFGAAALSLLPLRPLGRDGLVSEISLGEDRPPSYVQASAPASAPGWTLQLLKPSDTAVRAAVLPAQFITMLIAGLCVAGVAAVLRRSERQAIQAAQRERARAELEARVKERTGQLREANDRLVVEIDERRRAEALQHALQDDLVQASKLAVLGQIAAGVAHEINQPVAAIRTYAENAAILVDRAQPQLAKDNLALIASLTDRIGGITDELRAFSRKTTRETYPVVLEEAIAGALRLMGPRLRQQSVRLTRDPLVAELRVRAERNRLEQVLVNLLQNAIEALSGRPDPTIHLDVAAGDETVAVTVSDNGPGLDSTTAAELFTPFVTTKANGLGLGLVISRDIMTEFGGELSVGDPGDAGAAFVLTLRRST
jgi:two-component system C4-dicarboxylate transport sensor histidine kinase DctB